MLPACGAIEYQSDLIKPAVTGRPGMAGVGDTVMDMKLTQSLPNAFGKADLFGRTRDAGRMTVRLVGADGNHAVFVRQDVAIQSNESTMTRSPLVGGTLATSSVSGKVGNVPVSATRSTAGLTSLPAVTPYSYPIQAGQVQIVVPVGGMAMVAGRRLKVLRAVEGGVEYSVE